MKPFEDINLIDWLRAIIEPPGEGGVVSSEPFAKDRIDEIQVMAHYVTKGQFKPTREQIAQGIFVSIHDTFMKCTEAERRNIARSDIEFIYLMKQHIAKRLGFGDEEGIIDHDLEQQIYKEHWIPTPHSEIPKIPRGKELFWSTAGDPIPQRTSQEKKRDEIVHEVMSEVWDNVEELYPEEYSKSYPIYVEWVKSGKITLGLNINHKENMRILNHARRGIKFYSVTVPWLSAAIVDVVARICGNIDEQRKKTMAFNVTKATWDGLVEEVE
jgi:hypothetical protein